MPSPSTSIALSTTDHRRDNAGMTYVYAVASRRAGGISVGINLNPNNACNWRCIYCQVPDLKRGGPPPIDLEQLDQELGAVLGRLAGQTVVDVAFSGNGEPTMATEFFEAVSRVARTLAESGLDPQPKIRLITNGSQLGKAGVQQGIARLGEAGGETWFKVDAVGPDSMRRINQVSLQAETVARRLGKCANLCPTWVQTCLFALDGMPPGEAALKDYLGLLMQVRDGLRGVHLYGLARPSQQPEASRLQALPGLWLDDFANQISKMTGLPVRVSP